MSADLLGGSRPAAIADAGRARSDADSVEGVGLQAVYPALLGEPHTYLKLVHSASIDQDPVLVYDAPGLTGRAPGHEDAVGTQGGEVIGGRYAQWRPLWDEDRGCAAVGGTRRRGCLKNILILDSGTHTRIGVIQPCGATCVDLGMQGTSNAAVDCVAIDYTVLLTRHMPVKLHHIGTDNYKFRRLYPWKRKLKTSSVDGNTGEQKAINT